MGENEKPVQQNPKGPQQSSDLSATFKKDADKQGQKQTEKKD